MNLYIILYIIYKMDIQEKDNLVLNDNVLKNIDEIEYQKYIKVILEISFIHNLDKDTFFHAVDILKRYINIDSSCFE